MKGLMLQSLFALPQPGSVFLTKAFCGESDRRSWNVRWAKLSVKPWDGLIRIRIMES